MKLSKYNHYTKIADKYIIYNFYTGAMIALNEEKYYQLINNSNFCEEEINVLQDFGFLVDNNEQFDKIQTEYFREKFDNKNINLTFELTNACNLHCKYCYQERRPKKLTLDNVPEIVNAVEKVISKGIESLYVHWFGGEPTLNLDVLITLDNEFKKLSKDYNFVYNSNITTNGFDIDKIIDKLLDTSIVKYQITLDGIGKYHNYTRPASNGDKTFDKIFNNIKTILNNKKTVVIRYNMNKLNSDIRPFLEYIEKNNLTGDFHIHLHETTCFENSMDINNFYFNDIQEYSDKLNDAYKALLNYGYKIPKYRRFGTNCPFDCDNNFYIASDLSLLRCSSCDNSRDFRLGRIESQKFNLNFDSKMQKKSYNPIDTNKCRDCNVLPICNGGCFLKKSLKLDECIPEKYFLDDYVKMLYLEEKGVNYV